jgi:transposase InsO family protein
MSLHLPDDNGYKYLLVVVDVATRLCDAEPMKHVSPDECLRAIRAIYHRNIVNIPKQLISDSGVEFQGSFARYFRDHHVFQKTALPGRHRQVGLVERRNQDIGKALHMSMVSRELLTAETNREWATRLPSGHQ